MRRRDCGKDIHDENDRCSEFEKLGGSLAKFLKSAIVRPGSRTGRSYSWKVTVLSAVLTIFVISSYIYFSMMVRPDNPLITGAGDLPVYIIIFITLFILTALLYVSYYGITYMMDKIVFRSPHDADRFSVITAISVSQCQAYFYC